MQGRGVLQQTRLPGGWCRMDCPPYKKNIPPATTDCLSLTLQLVSRCLTLGMSFGIRSNVSLTQMALFVLLIHLNVNMFVNKPAGDPRLLYYKGGGGLTNSDKVPSPQTPTSFQGPEVG